jgi:hypothetical protein
MAIIEGGSRRRYNANHSDLFIQARHERFFFCRVAFDEIVTMASSGGFVICGLYANDTPRYFTKVDKLFHPVSRTGRPHSLVCGYRLPCTGIPTLCICKNFRRVYNSEVHCRVHSALYSRVVCPWTPVGARCLLPLYLFLHGMRFSSRLLYCVYTVSCP